MMETFFGADMHSYRDRLYEYIQNQYGDNPAFLWPQHPFYAVLRHNSNQKWYAVIMDVPKPKLGIDGDGVIDILNVKCTREKVPLLLTKRDYLPAYHMNKNNWISVRLDGDIPLTDIHNLIDISFGLTAKLPAARRALFFSRR